jgi:aldehyde dehydrogenase (NAD+)
MRPRTWIWRPAIVFGALGTAGQRCTSTRRVLVHRSRLRELERRLVHAYQQVRIGDPLDPTRWWDR